MPIPAGKRICLPSTKTATWTWTWYLTVSFANGRHVMPSTVLPFWVVLAGAKFGRFSTTTPSGPTLGLAEPVTKTAVVAPAINNTMTTRERTMNRGLLMPLFSVALTVLRDPRHLAQSHARGRHSGPHVRELGCQA